MNDKKGTLFSLFFPLFFEAFLVTLVGVIDTAMVSSVSDNAVGAVGACNGNLYVVYMSLMVVSLGATALMSRFVGAGSTANARRTLWVSLALNAAAGAVFSVVLFFFAEPILTALNTAPEIYGDSVQYLRAVGASCFFLALNYVLAGYLRAFGKPKLSFLSAIIGNAVNVALNAVLLSQGFGTRGVALATLAARVVTFFCSAIFAFSIRPPRAAGEALSPCAHLLRSVLGIGIPASAESVLWTVWNAFNIYFINEMGAIAVDAYGYLSQASSLLFCIATGFTSASSILVGWHIGEGDREGALRAPNDAFRYGALIGLSANLVLIPLIRPILSLFSDNPAILAYATPIFAIQLLRLWGDLGNNVFGMALKTAGDGKTPLLIGFFLIPFWVFVGSYFFGVVLGFGLYGFWIGSALDEFCRCLLMRRAWRGRKWEKVFDKPVPAVTE